MASSVIFFENWRKVSKSSTCTIAAFLLSASFFSAARFYKTPTTSDQSSHSRSRKETYLLGTQHLFKGLLRIIQEHFLHNLSISLHIQFTQRLYTIVNPLIRVFVNLNRDKFRLTNSDDGSHNQHGFGFKRIGSGGIFWKIDKAED